MSESSEKRFDKIDIKLDELGDVMIEVAKAEVKLGNLFTTQAQMHVRVDNHGKRINKLEKNDIGHTLISRYVERFMWALVLGGITFFFAVIK